MSHLFTRENAGEMARRANAAIAARKAETARRLAQLDANTTEDARITRTKKQLARLDDLIDKSLDKADAELFLRLTAAKDRLWNLVSPKAGVLRPRRGDRPTPPAVHCSPIPTPQAPPA
jgi:hypothetical protein